MLPTPMPLIHRRRGDNPHVPLPFVPPAPRPDVTLAQHLADRNDPHGTLRLLNETLDTFVTGGRFVPETCRIELTHGAEVLASIDASPFVKDGMVQSVAVSDGNLVITWNSDSGALAPTTIPLASIFNPENYYDKTTADDTFVAKESGKGLTSNDFTTAYKDKLDGVEAGAEKNVGVEYSQTEKTKLSNIESGAKDNVVEVANFAALPETGAAGKLYITKNNNYTYRWDANAYVLIGDGGSLPVAPSTDLSAAGKAADAKATGDALAGKASAADATLTPMYSQTPTYSGWTVLRGDVDVTSQVGQPEFRTGYQDHENVWLCEDCLVDGDSFDGFPVVSAAQDATSLSWEAWYEDESGTLLLSPQYAATRTRTDIIGYTLGSQSTKPLGALDNPNFAPIYSASATYAVGALCVHGGVLYRCTSAISTAEAWNSAHWAATDAETELAGKQDAIADLAAIRSGAAAGAAAYQKPQAGIPASDMAFGVQTSLGKADSAVQPAALAGYATNAQLPYDLGTPIVIDTASSETVEGETVYYGAATLANRTANIVKVTAATALDELRLTFPAAVSGKVRDFGLRVEVGDRTAALTAPALVPPAGVTLENADGAIPALADGTATAAGVTLLYFSETAPGVFLVKGEQVQEA